MPGPISATAAKGLVHGANEIAFLDVREHGLYGEGHPFLAVPCPYSRLELDVGTLVPRAGVPVLLIDDGDGLAERAAAALGELGYRDVSWIEGGAPAWNAAGFTLFKGVNLPSKTLGELLEEVWHVPCIGVDTLAAWQAEGREVALFDGRPAVEYAKTTLPGAASAPNGELAHRFPSYVADPAMLVIVHCAGRTRSIVGAASLALGGIANPVYALENGTQGWALSGRDLARGQMPTALPDMSEDAKAESLARANRLIEAASLSVIDAGCLEDFAGDASRTLYVLDVRSEAEVAADGMAGAVHAPAVQLVQATDLWIGVRRARVVLVDDTGLRAATSAVFLAALGYEVHVLRLAETASPAMFERLDAPVVPSLDPVPPIAAADAVRLAEGGGTVLDLRGSLAFRAGHLAGGRWSTRARLPELPPQASVALVGPKDVVALAARDLLQRGVRDVRHVGSSSGDWRKAGLAVVATPSEPSDHEAIDHLFFVHDRHDGNLDAARRYLAWEQGLVGQLDEAERAEFRIGPSPFPGASG